jgi:tripartite-type tricarboxylate transporter receptor subunit TctC
VQRLAREVRRVLSLDAMKRFLEGRGIEAGDLGPEELKAYIAAEHARYGRMVRETGVRIE